MLVVEGDLARIRRALLTEPVAMPAGRSRSPQLPDGSTELLERTQDYLRKEFSGVLKLPFHKIDPQAPLEKYGIDSILAMQLTNQLEKTFGSLSKTLFFEYRTVRELAGYLHRFTGRQVDRAVCCGKGTPKAPDKLPAAPWS